MSTSLTAEQIKSVKGRGFLINRGTSRFSARILTDCGRLTSEQLNTLSRAAEKYGSGTVLFTVRLTVEVPGIEFDDIDAFTKYIAAAGLAPGGTGAKVRPVVSCKGTTCVYGLYDTRQLGHEIHQHFYEGYRNTPLPHKFKIAVGGCPNNCVKPELNDVGIVGQRIPDFDLDSCKSCKICKVARTCPVNAAQTDDTGKVFLDRNSCINCGRCAHTCPFDVTSKFEDRYKIHVGGKWGKSARTGTALDSLFTRDEVFEVTERALLLFKDKGMSGERFGDTCDRLGMDNVNRELASR